MDLFKECRTITPVGQIHKHYDLFNPKTNKDDKNSYTPESCVSLDIRKAYTHAYMKISEIPVFTQFDVWKPYDQKVHDHSKLHGLTLYLLKAKKQNMFFNKTYNLQI